MSFIKVATTGELAIGQKKKITTGGKEIILSNIDGDYYAITNVCPHMGASLFEGINGDFVVCPKHKAKFDLRNGKIVEDGKMLFMKLKVKNAESYAVKVDGEYVLVDLK